jgi:mediator of RNA polymerase II transcription subunit 21
VPQAANTANPSANPPHPHTATSPTQFAQTQRELARDLVIKEQQIEYLIDALPGIGKSEREQARRLVELEEEMRGVEERRVEAVRERERVRQVLDRVIECVRRV